MLLLPVPDKEGVEKTIELVKARIGRDVSYEEAENLLGGVMRYLYLLKRLKGQVGEAKAKGE